MNRSVSSTEAQEMYESFGRRIRGVTDKLVKAVTCAYTVTAHMNYLVDWMPGSSRRMLVSACMGRGFKHSAALGEAVAQLVTVARSDVDVSAYQLGGRLT